MLGGKIINKKLDKLAEEVLSQLEFEETKLLEWGFIKVLYNAEEKIKLILNNPQTPVLNELWEDIKEEGYNIETIIDNLLDRKLLFKGKDGYRSRYAETYRLLYQMKQRFSYSDWQSSSDLVSHIKPRLRYRTFPKREVSWENFKFKIQSENLVDNLKLKLLYNLLNKGEFQLSQFQVDSTIDLLKPELREDQSLVIGAGTGSGKTLAFYLPAITHIASKLREDESNRVRIIATYPRTELLKDQINEVLIKIIKINNLLQEEGLRPLSVGAYYGETPYDKNNIEYSKFIDWEEIDNGNYICPFFICPECGSEMFWQAKEAKENLSCKNCQTDINNKNIMLTRNRMKEFPPDILFTTTEMMNRNLSNNEFKHIFGINNNPPEYFLLDEAHIYSNINGAQVGYLLRRWRNLKNKMGNYTSTKFVGLSATLTNPQNFFSKLTGISENHTKYISPTNEEQIEEGMEYNLILRGDPISKTSLLSTTVQTSMLLSRVMDPLDENVSNGAWGKKIFGFSDKLDVTNRWYHIQWDTEDKLLSKYRDKQLIMEKLNLDNDNLKRIIDSGQVWPIADSISEKTLKNPISIDKTSSQSRGVDKKAKFVVTTSTLEVGYNDSELGGIIQHKSPHNLASFLQRKGRGGRPRGMRPWTVVITSAYGRDRWFYENPDYLFSPTLPELNLPVKNTYVQKIHASFAVMDWLALKLQNLGYNEINLWNLLSSKKNHRTNKYNNIYEEIISLLEEVIYVDHSDLYNFTLEALNLDKTYLNEVFWQQPRPIILDLIPNLIIKLRERWSKKIINNKLKERNNNELSNAPLSDYISNNLFTSIEAREIEIEIPNYNKSEYMPIRQALFEFAPNNASKRYSDRKYGSRYAHWISIDINKDFLDLDYSGIISRKSETIQSENEDILLYEPYKLDLSEVDKGISDRSRGEFLWKFLVRPNDKNEIEKEEGFNINLLSTSVLNNIISCIKVYSHENNEWINLIRYSKEVSVELKYEFGKKEPIEKDLLIKKDDEEVAIGFNKNVDGIVISCNIPEMKSLVDKDNWSEILPDLRKEFYHYYLRNNDDLISNLSKFEINWLWEISTSAIIGISISGQKSIEESIEIYKENRLSISKRVLEAIFQVSLEENIDDKDLQSILIGKIHNDDIFEIIINASSILYKDLINDEIFWAWLDERFVSTIAAAFDKAIQDLIPDLNTDDLMIDIKDNKIWFTEPDSGGIGIINGITDSLLGQPRRFIDLFKNAIEYCPRQSLNKELNNLINNKDKVSEVFNKVRNSSNLDDQKEALDDLRKELFDLGITPKKETVIAIMSKILHDNSSLKTDNFLKSLLKTWEKEEDRINLELDNRILSVVTLQLEDYQEQIINILKDISGKDPEEKQMFSFVESLLWSKCNDSCPECLDIYNPYKSLPDPARMLLKPYIEDEYKVIKYKKDWQLEGKEELKKENMFILEADNNELIDYRNEILEFILNPAEIDYEIFYPKIEKVQYKGNSCLTKIGIREVLHE